jgi:hypothetical protein
MNNEQCDQVEQDFRVTFPGPFQHHDVMVAGWRVPFLEAHPQEENRITLTLDRRLGLDVTTQEAERLIPFLADAIAVGLGYGAHPRGDMSLPERRPHPSPRRSHEIVALRS